MGKMPHIQLDRGINAAAAILPGDPARVDAVAEFLEDVREEAFSREYKSVTGTYKGRRILAISTGMGGPSTAICVEELADLGVTDMIRIGSCGALQSSLALGQLVLCSRAVCDDGTSQTYLDYLRYAAGELGNGALGCGRTQEAAETQTDICYAEASGCLQEACEAAAKDLAVPYAVGSTRSHDGLYLPKKPLLDEFYSGKGVYASDMETAALFAAGKARGVRTASILNVVVEWKKDLREGVLAYKDKEAAAALGEKNEILVALEALHRMGTSLE
ncbi:MAG: nucleoside phosphorylase [Lachnospiraceae bacterium]|nr:nucleoside phosphorylase [Lachnospiraceae bacterium]